VTLTDLESLAAVAANNGYHFAMSRTKCRRGKWEARFNPHDFTAHDREWPFGKSDDPAEAIRQAVAGLPEHVREAINQHTKGPQ
jgi:hypothetical protein